MSFILPTLHRQAAKEVGVQTESFHAPTFPEARSGERVLHLRVSESTDLLGSAQCHRLPGGWEGLIAVSEALQMRGGCVQVLPLSGAARATAELGYSLGADAIQGVLNGFGIVVDDVISILCKSSHVLSPDPGWDSVFSDPEALRQMVLEVRAEVRRPTRTQLADALLDIGALRLSAGHAIALVMGAVASLLSSSRVDDGDQGHIMSGCLALMAMIIYFPLVFGSAKRTDNTYTLQETVVP